MQGKEAVNARNQYNRNFEGLYCTCKRPYPDSEDEVSKETRGYFSEQWRTSIKQVASFPGLPRFFCSSVSVDNNTRMRKGGVFRCPSASVYYCQRKPKNRINGVGLETRLQNRNVYC